MAVVDHPPGCGGYGCGDCHLHLVDMKGMATRTAEVVGRTVNDGRGVGGGEGGCGSQVMSLCVADLRGFEPPSCW